MSLKRFLLPAAAILFAITTYSVFAADAPAPQPEPAAAAAPAVVDQANALIPGADYLIQPGDVLQISVWKEPDLTREVLVRPDGGLSFPLAGDVQAAGNSVPDLEKDLTKRIQKYIPEAVVTVAIRQALGYRFYVVGRVNRPGEFNSVRPIDVMQALALAGGTTSFAAQNDIKILRRVNGVETSIPFRYGRVQKGKSLKENIILKSGDIVVVP
jgi:polysaccharide export outer membrane protein